MKTTHSFIASTQQLLKTFQQGLKAVWKVGRCDKLNIEHSFLLCNRYWETLREMIKDHSFDREADEIEFFKHIKPAFTCEIEYYSLLYQADMFIPEDPGIAKKFWERESQRLSNFLDKYKSVCNYLRSDRTDLDSEYFLRKTSFDRIFPVSKIYSEDVKCATGYDHILACLIAHERYHQITLKKLAEVA